MLKENNYYQTHHKGKKAFGIRSPFTQIKSSCLRISEKILNDNFTVSRENACSARGLIYGCSRKTLYTPRSFEGAHTAQAFAVISPIG